MQMNTGPVSTGQDVLAGDNDNRKETNFSVASCLIKSAGI